MTDLLELPYHCPYCGEPNVCRADPSLNDYQIIEDCFVCCRPIELHIEHVESGWHLSAHTDSD